MTPLLKRMIQIAPIQKVYEQFSGQNLRRAVRALLMAGVVAVPMGACESEQVQEAPAAGQAQAADPAVMREASGPGEKRAVMREDVRETGRMAPDTDVKPAHQGAEPSRR